MIVKTSENEFINLNKFDSYYFGAKTKRIHEGCENIILTLYCIKNGRTYDYKTCAMSINEEDHCDGDLELYLDAANTVIEAAILAGDKFIDLVTKIEEFCVI